MISSGRDATHRNRNMGKTQGGRVQDGGRAREKRSHIFTNDIWERLSELQGPCIVLRENPSRDYFHPCTGDEYLEVLRQLPEDVTDSVQAIVLHRLSKLDEAFGVEARKRYFCVILNSFPKSLEMSFGRTLSEGTISHYDPWCKRWVRRERGWKLVWSVEEIRRYYLNHLFLHEIGHLNQPWRHHRRIRESFAENFALEWARRLGTL